MEIILMTKIENLGDLGDIVHVRPGYARNYLLPYGKAQMATEENVAELQARKAKLEQELQEAREQAQAKADQIDGKVLEIVVGNVSEEGKLSGSIGTSDIIKGIHSLSGVEIEKSHVRLSHGVFREIGEYDVPIHLHADVDAVIKLHIIDADQESKDAARKAAAEQEQQATEQTAEQQATEQATEQQAVEANGSGSTD